MPYKDPEKAAAQKKRWAQENRARDRELHRLGKQRRKAENPERFSALQRAASKRWNDAHPDQVKARWASYSKRHRAELNAKARQHYGANQRKRIDAVLRSRAKNIEMFRAYHRLWSRKRKAMEAGAAGECSLEQWRARSAMWGGRCWLRLPGCLGDGKQIDHVIPVMRGGTNWPANLRPACKHCNRAKGAKDWRLFVRRR